MRTVTTTVWRIAAVIAAVALALVAGGQIASVYGQNPGQLIPSVPCQPFQQTVVFAIGGGSPLSAGTISVTPRTRVTIEQVALRLDATDFVVPAVAELTTALGAVRSGYYLPIPPEVSTIDQHRPLTLMQRVRIHADGGTEIRLLVWVDSRYLSGSGRAEWSVSGETCPA